jgi:hypothetical protein
MNRKLTTLMTVLILGAAPVSGCTTAQSAAAGPSPGTVSPINAPTATVTESPPPHEPTPQPTSTPKPEPTATEEPVSYDYEGWQPFESQRFGYAFLAPPGVEVMENGIEGTVNLSGPLVDNERWPCITIFSHDSDFFRPPAPTSSSGSATRGWHLERLRASLSAASPAPTSPGLPVTESTPAMSTTSSMATGSSASSSPTAARRTGSYTTRSSPALASATERTNGRESAHPV